MFWQQKANKTMLRHTHCVLRVVNESAERGVKLMEDYNKLFTKNEPQKQYVLRIVSDYRRKFPGYKKETLFQRRDL